MIFCALCPGEELALPSGVCDRHSRIVHAASLVVGCVKKVHAPGEWIGENGRAVTVEVIELTSGDAFIGAPGDAFRSLSEEELALYERLIGALASTIVSTLRSTVPPSDRREEETSRVLVRASLAATLRRLNGEG